MNRLRPFIAAASAMLLLAGCAAATADRGFEEVSGIAQARLGLKLARMQSDEAARAIRARTEQLLRAELTADAAVEVALLNNRGFQAALAELGIGAADLARAQQPPVPGFTFSRLRRGDELEIERSVSLGILGLVTWPFRAEAEARAFERQKRLTAQDAVRLAAQTRRAYFAAVAAAQSATYADQALAAASARAELARRMNEVGNWSLLNYAREQAFAAEAAMLRTRARIATVATRERLTRLLGLYGGDIAYELPPLLPRLPEQPIEVGDAEARAMRDRLDVQAARANLDVLAATFGLTKVTRFIDVFEGGYERNSDSGRPVQKGYEIHIEVPIFDFGEAALVSAEARYWQAVHRLADIAVNARSEVRETHAAYLAHYQIANQYRREVLPLRQRISEELVLRYNNMLTSVFELLAEAREQIAATNAAIEAQRDFWIADTDLQFALIAETGPESAAAPTARGGAATRAAH